MAPGKFENLIGDRTISVEQRPRIYSDELSYVSQLSAFKAKGLSHSFKRKHFCFSEQIAKPLMSQILKAVQCMHSVGVVHRDLNPSNIFLDFELNPGETKPELKI